MESILVQHFIGFILKKIILAKRYCLVSSYHTAKAVATKSIRKHIHKGNHSLQKHETAQPKLRRFSKHGVLFFLPDPALRPPDIIGRFRLFG